MIYEVKVFDGTGKLKKILTKEEVLKHMNENIDIHPYRAKGTQKKKKATQKCFEERGNEMV